jgi:hypothetical protein
MTITDPQGRKWTAEHKGESLILLRRPGAIRWVTTTEIADWPRPGLEGLRRDGRWLVREGAS